MNNYNVMVRGIVENNDKDGAVQNVKRVRIYPLSEAANPKPNKYISMSGKVTNTIPPAGLAYWERFAAFVNNNPVQERDLRSSHEGFIHRRELACSVGCRHGQRARR